MLGYSVPAAAGQTSSAELVGWLLPFLPPPKRLRHGSQGCLRVQEDHYPTGKVDQMCPSLF